MTNAECAKCCKAEEMRKKAQEAFEKAIGPRADKLYQEALRIIDAAASNGKTQVTWVSSGDYMSNYEDRITSAAVSKAFDMLRGDGFQVFTERRAAPGLGAIISW